MSGHLTHREYWDEIQELAKSIPKEAKEHDRDLYEVMHETIDGHQYVIYTYQSKAVLLHTRNDHAYEDNFGSEGVTRDGRVSFEVMAYCAMEQDVIDCMGD